MLERADGAPVVVLTGLHDRETGVSAVARGAADFLVKGDPPEALARSIRYAVERSQAESARALWRETELLRGANLRLERGLPPRPPPVDPATPRPRRHPPAARPGHH